MFIPAAPPPEYPKSGPQALSAAYSKMLQKQGMAQTRKANYGAQQQQQIMEALRDAAMTANAIGQAEATKDLAAAQSEATRTLKTEAAMQRIEDVIATEQIKINTAEALIASGIGQDDPALLAQQQAIISQSKQKINKAVNQGSKIFMNDEYQRNYADAFLKENPQGATGLSPIQAAVGAVDSVYGPPPERNYMDRWLEPPTDTPSVVINTTTVPQLTNPVEGMEPLDIATSAQPEVTVEEVQVEQPKEKEERQHPFLRWLMNGEMFQQRKPKHLPNDPFGLL